MNLHSEKSLEATIDTLTKAIDTLRSDISEMQVQMKRAGEDREKQNQEFQQTVADQRATQKLLQKALSVLEGFYDKKALLQEPAGLPPPASFFEYKKNAASSVVMGMGQQIRQPSTSLESCPSPEPEAAEPDAADYDDESAEATHSESESPTSKPASLFIHDCEHCNGSGPRTKSRCMGCDMWLCGECCMHSDSGIWIGDHCDWMRLATPERRLKQAKDIQRFYSHLIYDRD